MALHQVTGLSQSLFCQCNRGFQSMGCHKDMALPQVTGLSQSLFCQCNRGFQSMGCRKDMALHQVTGLSQSLFCQCNRGFQSMGCHKDMALHQVTGLSQSLFWQCNRGFQSMGSLQHYLSVCQCSRWFQSMGCQLVSNTILVSASVTGDFKAWVVSLSPTLSSVSASVRGDCHNGSAPSNWVVSVTVLAWAVSRWFQSLSPTLS